MNKKTIITILLTLVAVAGQAQEINIRTRVGQSPLTHYFEKKPRIV